MVADVPVGVLLSGGLDSSLVVALLAEQGQHGPARRSRIGFDAVGGREGDEFRYSDVIAARVRHRPPPDPGRDGRPGAAARGRRPRRCASRWSATTASRSTCSARRSSPSTSRWSSPARARTRSSPATTGTRRCSASPRDGRRRRLRQGLLRPRRTPASPRCCSPSTCADGDPARAFVAEHFARAGAETAVDARAAARHRGHARRRPGEAGRQHDDGARPRGARAVPRPRVRRAGRAPARRS